MNSSTLMNVLGPFVNVYNEKRRIRNLVSTFTNIHTLYQLIQVDCYALNSLNEKNCRQIF